MSRKQTLIRSQSAIVRQGLALPIGRSASCPLPRVDGIATRINKHRGVSGQDQLGSRDVNRGVMMPAFRRFCFLRAAERVMRALTSAGCTVRGW